MATRLSFGGQIVSADLRIQQLLSNSSLLGGIYTMGFNECLVLTNDIWKKAAGGVPQHCFLLATAIQPGQAPDAEDEEIILLRVVGPAPLPAEEELVAIRAEAMREVVTTDEAETAGGTAAIIDVLTRNEIQFSALRAKILGTFYETEVDAAPVLAFGSDVETFYSASRYKVYKPYSNSLGIIASYPEKTVEEERLQRKTKVELPRVRIGSIRYTSTIRRRQRDVETDKSTAVPVKVNVEDFIALKTAVFGMTRLGKSNTMKTLATAVFEHAQKTRRRIGQLLFDPAGEYANVNVQDQTALSQLGREFVTIFRYGAAEGDQSVRPLSLNFFAEQTIEVAWSIIRSGLEWRAAQAGYIRDFLAADVLGPDQEEDDRSAWVRARQRRAALFAMLMKAGFGMPRNFSVRFTAAREVREPVNRRLQGNNLPPVDGDRRGYIELNQTNLRSWFEALMASRHELPNDWIDSGMESILVMYEAAGIRGYRELQSLLIFHSPNRDTDYASDVLQELIGGKIVIVDLSLGTESVLQYASERIINHIIQDASRRFAAGEEPHSIQIYIEEAHRLFNRDRMRAPDETNPYVRLAKEAAKYKIGLIYATQEVSSVDPIILSNTSNWFVTHLNNRAEVKELSKYYDFEDFAELTLKAEDVGFVRLKTKSGRYIAPSQIDLFSPERVAAARDAALQQQAKK